MTEDTTGQKPTAPSDDPGYPSLTGGDLAAALPVQLGVLILLVLLGLLVLWLAWSFLGAG